MEIFSIPFSFMLRIIEQFRYFSGFEDGFVLEWNWKVDRILFIGIEDLPYPEGILECFWLIHNTCDLVLELSHAGVFENNKTLLSV